MLLLKIFFDGRTFIKMSQNPDKDERMQIDFVWHL